MTITKQLSDVQQHILDTATQRKHGALLPLSAELAIHGAARTRLLTGLLKAGLIKEVKAAAKQSAWREDANGGRFTLRLTPAGFAAVKPDVQDVGDAAVATPADAVVSMTEATAPEPSAPKAPGGKLGLVLTAVATNDGASLADLVSLTGWLPHTTRAAVTGLRQRGFPIRLEE